MDIIKANIGLTFLTHWAQHRQYNHKQKGHNHIGAHLLSVLYMAQPKPSFTPPDLIEVAWNQSTRTLSKRRTGEKRDD